MADCVFILNGDFYYDRDSRILHGTEGEVEVKLRLANVLDLFIGKPDHRIQLKHSTHFVEEPDFQLTKRTLRNYITEINGLGRQVGMGDSDIIKYHSMPDSVSRWTLQLFEGGGSDAQTEGGEAGIRVVFKDMMGDVEDARPMRASSPMDEGLASGWFATAHAVDHGRKLMGELSNYLAAIAHNSSHVITEYRSDMTVDVSGWPEKPYHIRQTVAQVAEGTGSDVFVEQCELQDELKASTFRYTSLVLRDEAGRELLRRNRIPHWSSGGDKPAICGADGWTESVTSVKLELDDPATPEIERLDYLLERDGFVVEVRSWPHHSAAFEWASKPIDRAPRRNRQGGYYTADVLVKSPAGRRVSVELSFQYDAWSVSDNRFFTELVYAPTISARIVGAEANGSGYDFRLRQYSSQSPFWRRGDEKRYVKDVMLAGNNPHYLSWHYPDQWLMLGEGYVVTVDASKPYERN